jgi:putative phosphoribosyl transferase
MERPDIFRDRADAGRELAAHLRQYAGHPSALVLGLARGGVPVAFEVAKALKVALDVFLVRKLGVPGREEHAFGAIASGGVRVLNEEVVQSLEIPEETIAAIAADEQRELERRERHYRDGASPAPVAGRTAILLDDGLATGASMRAAALALRKQGAGEVSSRYRLRRPRPAPPSRSRSTAPCVRAPPSFSSR